MNNILDFLKNIKFPKLGKQSIPRIIFWGVILALSVGLFIFARALTTCWQVTALPGIPPSTCGASTGPNNPAFDPTAVASGTELPPTPDLSAPVVEYPKWDGASRVNFVFFGLRGGDPAQEDCPLCTDTIIVFSVDPVSKTASMLSIPRDMYVNIPGFGFSRINTAWTDGEGSKLPGGGPGLAMKTVSQFIGLPIQYYGNVDFNTFVTFVDMIGGIDVYNDQELLLDPLGSGYVPLGRLAVNQTVTIVGKNANGKFLVIEYAGAPKGKAWVLASAVQASGLDSLPVVPNSMEGSAAAGITGTIIKAADVRPTLNNPNKVQITSGGIRHLNGAVALAYARCRDESQGCTDADIGRAKRQQRVILAIRDKVFSPEYFPKLIAQAPELYNLFSAGIRTNISLDDAIKLAVLAKDIPLQNVKQGVIDTTMATYDSVVLGNQTASVLRPIPDKIRLLRDELFTSGGVVGAIAQGDPKDLMLADAARISVLNGTYTAQLDARTGNYLLQQGMTVSAIGQAPQGYAQTTLVVHSPKLYALRYLITVFGITSSNQIVFQPDPAATVDIEVRIGTDWITKLPAGY